MRYGSLDITVEGDPPLIYIAPCNAWSLTQQHAAQDLASVLGEGTEYEQGSTVMVPYTEAVDCRLMHLIDVLAGIRYSVPQMTQLTLALDDDGELERRLQVALPGVDA